MSLFRRSSTEKREGPGVWAPWFGTDSVRLGNSVHAALRLGAVYSAVTLVTNAVSTLPVKAYRRTAAGRVALDQQPMLLTDPGVGPVNRVTWRCQMMASLLLRGNAFGAIASVDAAGWPTKVLWLNPDAVTVDETDLLNPRYSYLGQPLDRSMLLHIPAFVLPGRVTGESPIGLFRAQIETGIRAGEYGRKWFRNGVSPSGILRNSEQTVSPAVADVAKDRFKVAVDDGGLFVTGKDWDYTALTVTPGDAQFLETIKANATQIAAIYHVPPEDIGGEAGGSLTYSTVELNGIKFGQQSVSPWTATVEAALDRLGSADQYVKFNLDALARTDLKTRMDAHAVALTNGIETIDEARALEDRSPMTAEQLEQWLTLVKGNDKVTRIATMLQKMYLGAGVVLTSGEIRELMNAAGADLQIPGPVFPNRLVPPPPPEASA